MRGENKKDEAVGDLFAFCIGNQWGLLGRLSFKECGLFLNT
jgi:hypothetical protein